MAKNKTIGHLTTWPNSLITVFGRLPRLHSTEIQSTQLAHGQKTTIGHLTHMAKFSDHCIWPPAIRPVGKLLKYKQMANSNDLCGWPPAPSSERLKYKYLTSTWPNTVTGKFGHLTHMANLIILATCPLGGKYK